MANSDDWQLTSKFPEPDLLTGRQDRVCKIVQAQSGRQVQREPPNHERQELEDHLSSALLSEI